MAVKKIRVYELARELGVENQVVLELSAELKLGVKSPSSSIDDPSADRVRRLATSKGLKKEPVPEPVVAAEPTPAPVAAPAAAAPVAPAASDTATPETPAVTSRPATTDVAAPAAKPAAPVRSVRSAGAGVVRSTGGVPAHPPTATPQPTPERPAARVEADATSAGAPAPAPSTAIPETPAAASSRSAAQLRSESGKVIPPPPGLGGRRVPPPPRGPGQRPGGPGGAGSARTGSAPGQRTGGGPGGGGGGGGFQGGGGRPGGGGGPGGGGFQGGGGRPGGGGGPGGGGRGGPGGSQRRPSRRKKRRRDFDESELQQSLSLTPENTPVPEGEIVVPRGITIQDYAPKLNRRPADLVKLLFDAGEMITSTASLADEMIELIAESLGAQVLVVEPGSEEELELIAMLTADDDDDDETQLEARPPIITVMGHVDHGKTTLLDAIRQADVAAGEAGGITQHIGAYQVHRNDRLITFIDTPGHEAFTAMRRRGAQVTDIAVLVAAADDGIMPQTIEAIHHAKAAEVPIVVAVTKTDREDADPTRVRAQLTEYELVPEEYGGDVTVINVAAKTGAGIDELLEALLNVADFTDLVEELVANPHKPARAAVLESHLDPGRGPVATALVFEGTLRVGDTIVAGPAWGRVRAMFDEHGKSVTEAGPSKPVEVLGLDDVPLAGDELRAAPSDRVARTVAEARKHRRRTAGLVHREVLGGGARLEDIFAMVQRGEVATLNLILKADVQGSLEAVTEALRKVDQTHDEVRLSFVHRGVGGITESDITLAAVSNATVIGFNVRPDRKARETAEREGVDMRLYEVIYGVLEDVNKALVGMLKPEFEEIVTGEAEVREVFRVPRIGAIAGCYVQTGVITRGSKVRFLREGTVIWNGSISSLKRFKEDAREVRDGFECGVGLDNYQDLKPGDMIETYEEREIVRT